MAGFGGGDGDAHGFRVAHFADDDDVWSLAQGGAQCGGKIGSVGADFDLFDDAANVAMLVLDGIFDDDNVAGFAMIDFVDERGHGGGFAGAGGAAEKNKSAWEAWRDLLRLAGDGVPRAKELCWAVREWQRRRGNVRDGD